MVRQIAQIGEFEISRHEEREALEEVTGGARPRCPEVHAIATQDLITNAAISAFSQTTLVDTITLTDSVAAVAATSGTLADRMRVLTFSQLITDTIKRLHHPLDGSQ